LQILRHYIPEHSNLDTDYFVLELIPDFGP